MANYTELELPNGKTYKFTPMPFTEENAELICELTSPEDGEVNVRKVLPALARVVATSLLANHSADELVEAQSCIPLVMTADSVLYRIIPVLMGQ